MNKLKIKLKEYSVRVKAYIKRLLHPIYLFPIKLVTYSLYYLIKFIIKLIISLLKILRDFIVFPFRSLKNFLKSVFIVFLVGYIGLSLFINYDYVNTHYGWYKKYFKCTFNKFGINNQIKSKVVRIVGGYSEGTGFFVSPNEILTNFHVIADEPSPKIIFPDGHFVTPRKILGAMEHDFAIIFTVDKYPDMVLNQYFEKPDLIENEPLFATGYAMGTELTGAATQLKGTFIGYRKISELKSGFVQANINLVPGMSGGPLTDQCGTVVGINTITVGGFSLFINEYPSLNDLTANDIQKITVDPSISPEKAVEAYYTYLKARRMKESFSLLSRQYLTKTNFEEWSNRFVDVIDFQVIKTEMFEKTKDTVFVKFTTRNWNGETAERRYYEGTWQTIQEDGVYKMLKSNIKEMDQPDEMWFYT